MDKMKLIWLYWRHCFLAATMCSYLLASLTLQTAKGQWLLGAFRKQTSCQKPLLQHNRAPQLNASYNKWSNDVS